MLGESLVNTFQAIWHWGINGAARPTTEEKLSAGIFAIIGPKDYMIQELGLRPLMEKDSVRFSKDAEVIIYKNPRAVLSPVKTKEQSALAGQDSVSAYRPPNHQ